MHEAELSKLVQIIEKNGFPLVYPFSWPPENLSVPFLGNIPSGLEYLERDSRFQPKLWWDKKGLAFAVGKPYKKPPLAGIAQYATGMDYHKILKDDLLKSVDEIKEAMGNFDYKISIDTSPIAERSLAAYAGLGWVGKNGLILNKKLGSLFFLGILVTDIPLNIPRETKYHPDYCGNCRRCIDACPTQALMGDPTRGLIFDRCISYWNNEFKGDVFPEHVSLEGYVVGCDICQNICPWNKKPLHVTDNRMLSDSFDFIVSTLDENIGKPSETKAYHRLKKRLVRNIQRVLKKA